MLMIGKIREENCITQEQLAQKSGLDVSFIKKLESGEIYIKDVTIVNFARILRGLDTLCPNGSKIKEDYATFMSAYTVVRGLLK